MFQLKAAHATNTQMQQLLYDWASLSYHSLGGSVAKGDDVFVVNRNLRLLPVLHQVKHILRPVWLALSFAHILLCVCTPVVNIFFFRFQRNSNSSMSSVEGLWVEWERRRGELPFTLYPVSKLLHNQHRSHCNALSYQFFDVRPKEIIKYSCTINYITL